VTSREPQIVRGSYLAMELTGWYVIVPFCLASLVTGLVVSLGTPWGLFRHYWVLVKFLITVISALILFGFTQTLSSLGDLAADATLSMYELRNLKQSPVLHSGGGLLAIFVATILAVYKPWGMTPYGRRERDTGVRPDYGSTASTLETIPASWDHRPGSAGPGPAPYRRWSKWPLSIAFEPATT